MTRPIVAKVFLGNLAASVFEYEKRLKPIETKENGNAQNGTAKNTKHIADKMPIIEMIKLAIALPSPLLIETIACGWLCGADTVSAIIFILKIINYSIKSRSPKASGLSSLVNRRQNPGKFF